MGGRKWELAGTDIYVKQGCVIWLSYIILTTVLTTTCKYCDILIQACVIQLSYRFLIDNMIYNDNFSSGELGHYVG